MHQKPLRHPAFPPAFGLPRCAGAAVFLLIGLLVAVPLVAPMAQVAAPDTAASESQPAPRDVQRLEDLLQTIENPDERERFLGRLRALVEAARAAESQQAQARRPESPGARVLGFLSDRISAIGTEIGQTLALVATLPEVGATVWQAARTAEARQRWLEVLGKLVLVLGVGLVAEWLLARLLARPRRSVEARPSDSPLRRILLFVARAVLVVLPIGGFAVAAYVTLPLTEPREATRLIALVLINASVLARAIGAVTRLALAPQATQFRLLPLDDETANYGYLWVRRLTVVTVYGYFLAEATLLLGLAEAAYQFLLKAVGLVVAGMLVLLVLQNRAAVAGWISGGGAADDERRGLRARFADIWHVLAIIYLLGTYGVWALGVPGGFEFLLRATLATFAVIAVAQLASLGVRRSVERGFRLSGELRQRYPGLETRANRYLPVLQRILKTAIWLLAGLGLLEVWGFGTLGWLATENGRAVGGRILTIVLVVGAAVLLWELTGTAIEAYLRRREATAAPGGGKRLMTLLPLMRNAMRVLLGVMVVMIVLSELGIDIAPLLAGAGVVGLAVGFGAQTLVKDVITGVFILLEESVRAGDVAEVGGHTGIVERLTIRTIVLRDLEGVVHIVPFSEVTSIRNLTMDYAYAFMEIGIAYREDVDKVIEVLHEIAAGMQEDETYGPQILEPLEVFGLDSFGDSSVNIRIRLKTQPIKQFGVRREFYRRMKRVFDERGIEIPFPHRTIYFGVDKEGLAPPARIVQESPPAAGQREETAPEAANPGNPGTATE